MEKKKASIITLNLTEENLTLIEEAKVRTGEKTATKAILISLKEFNTLVDELQSLKEEIQLTEKDREILLHLRKMKELL